MLPPLFPEPRLRKIGEFRQDRLAGRDRWLMVALAAVLLGLLGVARGLTPEPSGHGTHRQLGLPPCTFLVLFGRPCPSCGMTTAWACLVRGEVIASFRANAGGAVLAALAAAAAVWLPASAACGRWLGWTPETTTIAVVAVAIAVLTAGQWAWRLVAG
jgi:hypothetical protein